MKCRWPASSGNPAMGPSSCCRCRRRDRPAHAHASALVVLVVGAAAVCSAGTIVPAIPVAGSGEFEIIVPMRPFFHAGMTDYFLFKRLVPQSAEEYFAACVSALFLSFTSVAMQTLTPQYERNWREEEVEEMVRRQSGEVAAAAAAAWPSSVRWLAAALSPSSCWRRQRTSLARNDVADFAAVAASPAVRGTTVAFRRATWSTLSFALANIVMLILMSFNVGFFFSVLAGHFLGVFFLQRTAGANEEAVKAMLRPVMTPTCH